uniref:ORF143 me53 n=1 Tax=Cydia pomonella granulosis virus TaxID=28289 RepID=A0A097P192_GVCP|nr:ORF143 me53 [Cydia pomonella granulovirus]
MQDFRTQFLSKETEEVMFALVGLAQKLHSGLDTTPCYACNQQFKHIKNTNPFIFVVIKNYLNEMDDTLKYCCLKCWQHSRGVMDIIELYPTLKLCDVKKLMYNGVLRKFFFNFVDNTTVLYKKYAIVDSVDSVLEQMLQEKRYNDEIQMVRLVRNNNEFVAEESVAHLRMEYGRQHNFDRPLQLNAQLIAAVNKHCQLDQISFRGVLQRIRKVFTVCGVLQCEGGQGVCLLRGKNHAGHRSPCVQLQCVRTHQPQLLHQKTHNDVSLLDLLLRLQQSLLENAQTQGVAEVRRDAVRSGCSKKCLAI